jgi:hypothetical protein
MDQKKAYWETDLPFFFIVVDVEPTLLNFFKTSKSELLPIGSLQALSAMKPRFGGCVVDSR